MSLRQRQKQLSLQTINVTIFANPERQTAYKPLLMSEILWHACRKKNEQLKELDFLFLFYGNTFRVAGKIYFLLKLETFAKLNFESNFFLL